MKQKLYIWLAILISAGVQTAASAQNENPNLRNFYMGRQQWDIIPNAPIVNDRTGGAAAPGDGGMSGSMPQQRQTALPQAGWNSYAPAVSPPGLSTSLPKVNNGVPTKPAQLPAGKRGKPGALIGAKKPTPAGPKVDPNALKAYKPYNTYSNPDAAATAVGDGTKASVKVHGNVVDQPPVRNSALHWARGH